MAEIAVNLVVDKLIPLLRDEVKLLASVRGQIKSIRDTLLQIQAYLRDADAKAEMLQNSEAAKEWVKQLRQVSFRISRCHRPVPYKVANIKNKRPQRCGAVVGVLCKICDLLRTVVPRHEISSQIGEIKESIKKLYQERDTFGFNASAPESSNRGKSNSQLHHLRLRANYIGDDELVGVEHTKQLLNDWLLEEGKRTVISVVGEGGLGKTTVVRNVYNRQKERRSFDHYAWVTVSRSLRGEHLLKTLLQSFYQEAGNKTPSKEVGELDYHTVILELKKYLEGKKYLIVFDDAWEIDHWGGVEFVIPKDNGRVIITTRNKGVAESCKESARVHIHELKPLDPEVALELFRLKAFQSDLGGCPEELMALSKEFVKKCDGVPLAIVAIAALLSTKNKNVLEWQKVYDSLSSKLSSDSRLSSFYQVLSESYHDLSYRLKLCLLYFGLFPEQYPIRNGRLINLWIAEGFVEERENQGQSIEEVAEEYLAELISRSLVKVAEVFSYGRVKSCRVHDLMHDFILKKCEELNFCQVKKREGFRINEWTRRLSIDTNIEDAALRTSASNTRSDRKQYGLVRAFFVFNIEDMPATLVKSLFSSFELLVVLDCKGAPLDHLPEAVGNLFHLKYLNLKGTNIETVPKFIGKLQNLETLDIRFTFVDDLPVEINSLVKLRHLKAYGFTEYCVKVKGGIGNLWALHTLYRVDVSDDNIIRELKNQKQMRKLGISKLHRKDGKLLCSAMKSMTYLCSLTIIAAEEDDVLDLESLADPPPYLRRLHVSGRMEKLPDWVPRLKNLLTLELRYSRLTEDPLPLLTDLSELLALELREVYEGDELHFQEGWFKKLKSLEVSFMPSWTTFRIDKGGLPQLQKLQLMPRPQIVEVPDHVQKVATYGW